MSDDSLLPRLYDYKYIGYWGAHILEEYLPRAARPHDFLQILVDNGKHSRPWSLYVRVDQCNNNSRKSYIDIGLDVTVLLDDTLAYLQYVLQRLPDEAEVHLSMRPTDATVVRVFGDKLDPHWHAVHVMFYKMHLHNLAEWHATVQPLVKWRTDTFDGEDDEWNLLPLCVAPNNTEHLEQAARRLWEPKRSIFISGPPRYDGAFATESAAFLRKVFERFEDVDLAFYEGRRVYTLVEKSALEAYALLKPLKDDEHECTLSLTKPDHTIVADNEIVPEHLVYWSLPYLRQRCCAAALALCSELPIYCVLWIVQWLPVMYRLKDHELVLLIEGVYNSRKRILASRDEKNKNAKRND